MENKLTVSLSPHVHSGDSVKKNMYGVLIALLPAFLVSLYFFGLGALVVTATSVLACVFFEWAIGKFILKRETTSITDGSAIITGVLLAFNLPSNLPVWIIIIGYHHRRSLRHRRGQNVVWRFRVQSFQPGTGRTSILVAFLPGTDDELACCRPTDGLHRCRDYGHSVGHHEGSYQRSSRFLARPASGCTVPVLGQ